MKPSDETPLNGRARRRPGAVLLLVLVALSVTGCGRNMAEQPNFRNFEANPFFENGTTAQVPPEGTVSRERGAVDPVFFTGQADGGLVAELPIATSEELLLRGMERYNIYCAPCHNYTGDGRGVVVQRGFPAPTSFHDQRLRDAPVGHFFNAMTNGFGRMFPYASRIPPEDRWAIAGYIRALQLSRYATVDDLPADAQLESAAQEGVR
ncbi:MAG: cytochrome c [Trueperaceae bacterium]